MLAWARVLCVVAAVVCAPLAPPEHVHEAEDYDHHPHAVAHRHGHVKF